MQWYRVDLSVRSINHYSSVRRVCCCGAGDIDRAARSALSSNCEHCRVVSWTQTCFKSHAHTVVWACCKDDQQSQWEMLKFDPQLPLKPLSDRHQIWHAWLRHGYLSPRKILAQSVKGFLLPIYAKYTPPCSLRYVTLKCKKLNSLKHLVRTTVAGSHN